jgi:hypothetical protein
MHLLIAILGLEHKPGHLNMRTDAINNHYTKKAFQTKVELSKPYVESYVPICMPKNRLPEVIN